MLQFGRIRPQPSGHIKSVRGSHRRSSCTFDYQGPLHPEDLNCYASYFPNGMPFSHPSIEGKKNFTLGGVTWTDGSLPLPIFIIFKDRVSILVETLRSFYRFIHTPYEIIIINDDSQFPTAVNFLSRLKDSGVKVLDIKQRWNTFDEFYEIIADIVEGYLKVSLSKHYIVTDPDCALDSAPWNILWVYQHFLEKLELDVVGAALRWDDFPETMEVAYEANIAMLPAHAFAYKQRMYYYLEAPVDTTFAMYKAGKRLQRLQGRQIRMLAPLGARHLDFYLDRDALPEDYKYYHKMAREKQVNHMGHLDSDVAVRR